MRRYTIAGLIMVLLATVVFNYGNNKIQAVAGEEEIEIIDVEDETETSETSNDQSSELLDTDSFIMDIEDFADEMELESEQPVETEGELMTESGQGEEEDQQWKNCGKDLQEVYWKMDEHGTLILKGNGEMEDWTSEQEVPWSTFRSEIKAVQIEEGVLSIGAYAFYGCDRVQQIEIPESVSMIGAFAFFGCSGMSSIRIG